MTSPTPPTPGPTTSSATPGPSPSASATTEPSAQTGTQTSVTETAGASATTTAEPTATETATTTETSEPSTTETSTTEPTPDPDRPEDPAEAAWYDAVAAEHAAIYGYGLVSAHVLPDDNELVSESVAQHRDRREAAIAMLKDRQLTAPLPASGYQLPMVVTAQKSAAKLAIRMESDCAVAWRAVLEQTDSDTDREFGTTALTQCAVQAARWRRVLGAWPVTVAFPGGNE